MPPPQQQHDKYLVSVPALSMWVCLPLVSSQKFSAVVKPIFFCFQVQNAENKHKNAHNKIYVIRILGDDTYMLKTNKMKISCCAKSLKPIYQAVTLIPKLQVSLKISMKHKPVQMMSASSIVFPALSKCGV